MRITYDPKKRNKTLSTRQLDFADAWKVLNSKNVIFPDTRKNYGEPRYLCYGILDDRMVVVGFTPRGMDYHVFTMRKANEREQKRYQSLSAN